MGETKTHHVYDFGTFEPVTKPQTQLFLFLETPGHLTTNQENFQNTLKYSLFINIGIVNLHLFDILSKRWEPTMLKICLKQPKNLEYGTNVFLKT